MHRPFGINTHYSAGIGARVGLAALIGAVSCGGLVWAISLTRAYDLAPPTQKHPEKSKRLLPNGTSAGLYDDTAGIPGAAPWTLGVVIR